MHMFPIIGILSVSSLIVSDTNMQFANQSDEMQKQRISVIRIETSLNSFQSNQIKLNATLDRLSNDINDLNNGQ